MITDSTTAQQLLRGVDDTGVEWVLLHGEDKLLTGRLSSDLDIAVGTAPINVVKHLVSRAKLSGLRLCLLWPYDNWSLTTLWISPDYSRIAQLDLVFDPRGDAKYGLKTAEAISRRVRGKSWPILHPDDELAYKLSKMLVKGQPEQVQIKQLWATQQGRSPNLAVLSQKQWEEIEARNRGTRRRRQSASTLPELARITRRLRHRVGHILELPESSLREPWSDALVYLVARLDRSFPAGAKVALHRTPLNASRSALSPHVLVTSSRHATLPPDDLIRACVKLLAERTEARLQRMSRL